MKPSILAMTIASLISATAIASERQQVNELGGGWVGLTRQSDPFDTSKVEIIQMFKGDFTFLCGELNMKTRASGFDGFREALIYSPVRGLPAGAFEIMGIPTVSAGT
jgi:hypothetical protein